MVSIAIPVLWFLIGLIVLCGIVYLAIWVVRTRSADSRKDQARVWVVVLLLALIALLTAVMGAARRGFPPSEGSRVEPLRPIRQRRRRSAPVADVKNIEVYAIVGAVITVLCIGFLLLLVMGAN